MSASQNPSPHRGHEALTDSSNSPLVIFDGPGDTTRRPAPPNLPRYWPGREPPPELQQPPSQPPENPPPSGNR